MKHIQLFDSFNKRKILLEPLFRKKVKMYFSDEHLKIFRLIDSFEGKNADVITLLEKLSEVVGGKGVEDMINLMTYQGDFWNTTYGIYVNLDNDQLPTIIYNTKKNAFHCVSPRYFVNKVTEKLRNEEDYYNKYKND